jgi:hypothetical protein
VFGDSENKKVILGGHRNGFILSNKTINPQAHVKLPQSSVE